MNMKSTLIKLLCLALVLNSAFPLVTNAQTQKKVPSADWSVAQAIPLGTVLKVESKSGKSVEGQLESVSATGLRLTGTPDPVALERNDIRRIYQVIRRSRGRSAMQGTLIGAAAGAGFGLMIVLPQSREKEGAIVPVGMAMIGAGIGAAMGGIFGGKRRILIYDIKK